MACTSPLVRDSDRFAAAALQVDRLHKWIWNRNIRRREALPDEPLWVEYVNSAAGLHGEAPNLFPGPRSAWVR